MTDPSSPLGHNGGPPLDEDQGSPIPRYCKYCRHWSPPSDWEVHAYGAFKLGISRRRVKRPTGSCDRVLMRPGKPLAFSATTDTFGCLNFSAKPRERVARGHGFVTIYEGDYVVWQGWEKDSSRRISLGAALRLVDQLLDQSDRRIIDRPDRFAAAGTVNGPFETKRAIADAEFPPASRTLRLREDIVEIVSHLGRIAYPADHDDAAPRS